MTDITAGNNAGSLPHIRFWHRRRTLAEDLADRDIPTIQKPLVRSHKRQAIRDLRPGNLHLLVPILRIGEAILPGWSLHTTTLLCTRFNKDITREIVLLAVVARWQRRRIWDPRISHLRTTLAMPERLAPRIESALAIPGARVELESLYLDPLIRVRRRRGLRREVAYIAAWLTGVPDLDDV